MKKNLLYSITLLIIAGQISSGAFAASRSGASVVSAVKKYKAGNFTGCLQDMQDVVKRDPSNSVAYYYMAMSYVQAGKRSEAIDAYKKVLALKPNPTIYKYAKTGKACLETPESCISKEEDLNDLDKAVREKSTDGLTQKVRLDIEQKRLEGLKNDINGGKDINEYDTIKFKDYSDSRSEIKTEQKIAGDTQPTNDEIVAAMKVLSKAGLNPYAQVNPYMQAAGGQNPEMAQLSMLMGNSNQSQNNNSMMNMLPYMLAQNSNGANGTNNSLSPQIIQAMMMNSMMPDYNLNTDNDR